MALKTVTAKIPHLQLPERFKGTIVERWANYWKGLANDYKEVAVDSYKTIKTSPRKSAIYGSIGLFMYSCAKTNPDFNDFNEQLKRSEQLVSLVPVDSQNPSSVNNLKQLERCRNNETLRITSLGFFSIMWIADYAESLATYDATCKYLKPELRKFHERIIDVGWWHKWWNLENALKDYDVTF